MQLMNGESSVDAQLPRIIQQDFARHPKLVSLVRAGDPASALVLRIGTGEESLEATADLAAIVSNRLAMIDAEVTPDLGGITIAVAATSAAQLRAGAARVDAAIRRKIEVSELEGSSFKQERSRLSRVLAHHVSHSDRAFCLKQPEQARAVNLERFRQSYVQSDRGRWGVVGAKEVVQAAEQVLRELPPWPNSGLAPAVWPSRNIAQIAATGGRTSRIDITLRLPQASRCLAVARLLRSPSNRLSELLSALPTAMRVERVAPVPLALGGYIGLSITPDSELATTPLDELVSAARVTINELQRLVSSAGDQASAILTILDETDPRSAARLASQFSLSRDVEAEPHTTRFRVEIDPGALASSAPTAAQKDAVAALAVHSGTVPTIALSQLVERGQGKLHALLASPCATWDESNRLAGVSGFLMRVLAGRYRDVRGVEIEPWITSNGVGLMAHGGREFVAETPAQHAARLGDVMGRVLSTMSIDPQDVWKTRSELLATLGPGPRPALWRALAAFSPQQPGLLLPDGTFPSVEAISISDLRERRDRLMRLPWRLAVLANEDNRQAQAMREATMHWLSLVRQDSGECPTWQEPATLMDGDVRQQSKNLDSNDAAVTIALPLPNSDSLDEIHSTVLTWLLDRPTGWLSERLRTSNVVGSAAARVVGGTKRRGLVIALGVLPSAVDAAIDGIRALFDELGSGRIPQAQAVDRVIYEMAKTERARRFDPRVRVEDLWLGRNWDAKVTERSLRNYLVRAFGSASMLVVRSEPPGAAGGTNGKR